MPVINPNTGAYTFVQMNYLKDNAIFYDEPKKDKAWYDIFNQDKE